MSRTYSDYIGGQWVKSVSGRTFERFMPANRQQSVGSFQDSVPEDVQHAVEAASNALTAWRGTPAPQRGQILLRAAGILEKRLDDITKKFSQEEGKVYGEAQGEILRAVHLLQFYAGETWRITGETYPSLNPGRLLYTLRAPLGVVAVITPWNFPIGIPIWKIAPAVAYGNTVVFKPAGYTSLCGVIIMEIFEEAGFPSGVINMVTGSGRLLGEALVKNPAVRGVSFTGSSEVGRQIACWGSESNIKVQLEMGGKNTLTVLPDANLDHAATLVVQGAMWSAGQKCTATSLAIVHRDILDDFTKLLLEKVEALRVGDPLDTTTEVGPLVSESQLENVLGYVKIGCEEGAKLLIGGSRLSGTAYDRGFYMAPTVFGDLQPNMRIAQEEIFGPVVGIIPVDSFEEAVKVANGTKYGLSGAICTGDLPRILEYIENIDVGLVHINNSTAGAEPHVPFGGFKESTSGYRDMGRTAIDFFTQYKTVYFDPPVHSNT